MTNTSPQDVATRYIAAWNETDPVRRRALVAAVWTEEVSDMPQNRVLRAGNIALDKQ